MAATWEERLAAIEDLEDTIQFLEAHGRAAQGKKSTLLENSKEHLRALRAGEYDRPFAEIFVGGPGGICGSFRRGGSA